MVPEPRRLGRKLVSVLAGSVDMPGANGPFLDFNYERAPGGQADFRAVYCNRAKGQLAQSCPIPLGRAP